MPVRAFVAQGGVGAERALTTALPVVSSTLEIAGPPRAVGRVRSHASQQHQHLGSPRIRKFQPPTPRRLPPPEPQRAKPLQLLQARPQHQDLPEPKPGFLFPRKRPKYYTLGFAPDFGVMSEGTKPHWNVNNATETTLWEKYGKEWCGLEVEVIDPANPSRKFILRIVDAFNWPGMKKGDIDTMIVAWERLAGRPAVNKLDVAQWRLTGTRNPQYAFKGRGDT
ncbi:uncharacterized protein SPPG_09219 [Spizellomyces punctatus DAOM BR117]|uniref:Uncharacterized protein n=1 Tax=Spizellomyces punctatus (strain DAOM BR117) TaxID=645134 RepID=A0A0L0HHY3_SPIPD|nr:uncharacterized protein SPPG_09219 [Spizellomyces punctatus DAOM BR117]KND00429.1 hypothetical protein SPPG_09219 [Spizellomyces punctatus DAOM BR117]|eukprot:XP_016608468.1 hypothetical protein SPPG_09219 [Spizellomyces punctatus DAOM BR117]